VNDEEILRRLEEAEARCAALREVLEEVEELPWEAYSQEGGSALGEGNWQRTELRKGEKVLRHVKEVLRSDTGRDLLDRFRKLEAVATAAREYLAARELFLTTGKLPDGFKEEDDPTWKLRQALSALDEGDDGYRDFKAVRGTEDRAETAEERVWLLTEWHGRPTLIELVSGAEIYVDSGKRSDDPWIKGWNGMLCYVHPGRSPQTIARFDTMEEAEKALSVLAGKVKALRAKEELHAG